MANKVAHLSPMSPFTAHFLILENLCQHDLLVLAMQVRVFAGNPKGIVSVRFKTVEAADKCIETMSGRFFGGRKLAAHMWDGHTNYNVKLQESEEQLAARRAAFAAEIEAQELQTQQSQENNADPI